MIISKNFKKFYKKKHILIIGELILDNHFNIIKIGKSLETDTPKFSILNKRTDFGGAGKVYHSSNKILKLKNFFITSKKNDTKVSNDKNIFFFESKHIDIVKNRFWSRNKKIFQVNEDFKKKYLERKKFNIHSINIIKKYLNKISSIIISDYNHSLINDKLVNRIKELCKKKKIDIYVDKQLRSYDEFNKSYMGVDYLLINEFELFLLKKKFKFLGKDNESLKTLKKKLKVKNIILKKGKKGSIILTNKNKFFFEKPLHKKKNN